MRSGETVVSSRTRNGPHAPERQIVKRDTRVLCLCTGTPITATRGRLGPEAPAWTSALNAESYCFTGRAKRVRAAGGVGQGFTTSGQREALDGPDHVQCHGTHAATVRLGRMEEEGETETGDGGTEGRERQKKKKKDEVSH